jgi:hypothetical protein
VAQSVELVAEGEQAVAIRDLTRQTYAISEHAAPDAGPSAVSENRRVPRQRVLKGGRIVFNNGRSTIDCTVRNLSSGGAKLSVASVFGVPQTFYLVVGTENSRACQVVWHGTNELGVEFISE